MKWFETSLLALLALFAPAKSVLITVMVLSMVDLVTGLVASRKSGSPITSTGLKRTILKVVIYQVAVLSAFLVEQFLTGPDMPVMKWVSGLIGLVELKSVLENLDLIAGGSFFRSLTDRLQGVVDKGGKDAP